MKAKYLIVSLALTATACAPMHYQMYASLPAGQTLPQAQLEADNTACQEYMHHIADSSENAAKEFAMGVTLVLMPAAMHNHALHEKDAWNECMESKGYIASK